MNPYDLRFFDVQSDLREDETLPEHRAARPCAQRHRVLHFIYNITHHNRED